MATRGIINVHEEGLDSPIIVTIYRQYDCYPEGLGRDIRELLKGKGISNGITDNCFNGTGCLAASLVAHLKERVGNVYLYAPGTRGIGEEWVYDIYCEPGCDIGGVVAPVLRVSEVKFGE